MGRLIFSMSQTLDGYVASVDGEIFPQLHPDRALFRHFIDLQKTLAGAIYGRRMYEVLRYWDEDRPEWESHEHEFARVWRAHPKWVVSRTLKTVGPNVTIIDHDVEAFARNLKAQIDGDVSVAGPELAASLGEAGLIDVYDLCIRPAVVGSGKPYFAKAAPPLRFMSSSRVGDDALRLIYDIR